MKALRWILFLSFSLSMGSTFSQSDTISPVCKGYFKSYLKDTRNLIMFPREIKKQDWVFISSAAVGTGLAFYFDEEIEIYFRENNLRTKNDKWVDYSFGAVGNGIYPFATSAVLFCLGKSREDDRLVWLSLLQIKTLTLAAGFSRVPKLLAQRHRPDENIRIVNPWNWEGPLNGLSGNYSFASGHTFIAFSWASATASVCKENKLLVAGLYTLASLVGISRVYQGEHWASDVVAGAAMGYALGKLTYRMQERTWRKAPSKKIKLE